MTPQQKVNELARKLSNEVLSEIATCSDRVVLSADRLKTALSCLPAPPVEAKIGCWTTRDGSKVVVENERSNDGRWIFKGRTTKGNGWGGYVSCSWAEDGKKGSSDDINDLDLLTFISPDVEYWEKEGRERTSDSIDAVKYAMQSPVIKTSQDEYGNGTKESPFQKGIEIEFKNSLMHGIGKIYGCSPSVVKRDSLYFTEPVIYVIVQVVIEGKIQAGQEVYLSLFDTTISPSIVQVKNTCSDAEPRFDPSQLPVSFVVKFPAGKEEGHYTPLRVREDGIVLHGDEITVFYSWKNLASGIALWSTDRKTWREFR